MKTFKATFKTEFLLGLRQLDVPIFAFIFPVVLAVILVAIYGSGNTEMMGKTFASASTIGLAAMGLMGLPLTLAGYRDAKILKQLKVTPVKPSLILFTQFSVKLALALVSSVLVWLTMTVFFGYRMQGNPLLYLVSYLLVAFGIFGIGMVIASLSKDANTASLLCSIVYFPMLLFSGATLPLDILPRGVVTVLQVLPLTQGINLLETVALGGSILNDLVATLVMVGIGAAAVLIAIKTFRWE